MRLFHTVTALVLALGATPAAAQERGLSFALTGGAAFAPTHFGSASSEVSPTGRLGSGGLRTGFLRFGGLDRTALDGPGDLAPGVGLRGAFRIIPRRDDIPGLETVPLAVELGGGLHYTEENWQVFADLRYGVIGHRGFAGDIGANLIHRGANGLVLHAGPRAEFGNARFAREYFGVTAAEEGPSGLSEFSPGSGFHSLGFEFGAYQAISADWAVSGSLRFDQLRGDAADSPIVQRGQRSQISAEIGLTRHFNLRF